MWGLKPTENIGKTGAKEIKIIQTECDCKRKKKTQREREKVGDKDSGKESTHTRTKNRTIKMCVMLRLKLGYSSACFSLDVPMSFYYIDFYWA